MNQENANEKTEKTPQKQTQTRQHWIMFGCVIILFGCCILMWLKATGLIPLRLGSLEGAVVIMDENGNILPYRDTTFTFFSRYAVGFFRSDESRKLNYYIDDVGKFGSDYPYPIPKYPATLFFHTRNGKYAAVVDIAEGEPTTGLVVTLRPRHSATGRLVDRSGKPLAHYEFSLNFQRTPEMGSTFPFGQKYAVVETFESEYVETDADGVFTVDRLIPGVEYSLRTHLPKNGGGYSNVTMPILEPEQYREPFDLGDVVIKPYYIIDPSATRKVVPAIVEP